MADIDAPLAWRMQQDGYLMQINQLRDENFKLQRLIEKLHKCAYGVLRDLAPSCADLSIKGCGMDCTENGENCCMVLLEQYMRELKIETD